ncbi:MAG: hypothetical protein LBT89_01225 [Planctomycetaceae bacterium]|jgi:hypothetical protein|nr:hypothetical protein [Planctomycetaceae bacterium]
MAKKVEFDIQTVKKYIFWACVPAGLIFAVVGFYLSINAVGAAIETRKSTLTGIRNKIKTVQNASPHPNTETIGEIKKEYGDLSNKVYVAWETLEKDQKERNDWTKLGLSNRALSEIMKKRFLDPLEPSTLNAYREAVKVKALSELPKTVQPCIVTQPLPLGGAGSKGTATSTARSSRSGRSSRSAADDDDKDRTSGFGRNTENEDEEAAGEFDQTAGKHGIVAWDPPVLSFTLGDKPEDWDKKLVRAEAWKVWLTQEEIWVYDALLNVIKKSNDSVKAASPRSAVIKAIGDIFIGQEASNRLSAYSKPLALGGGAATGAAAYPAAGGRTGSSRSSRDSGDDKYEDSDKDEDYDRDEYRGNRGGVPVSGSVARDSKTSAGALKRRYVDKDGTPLDTITDAPYRRMPIFLSLVVDQKALPVFLTECANCAMPIDVLWVRLNPKESKPFAFTAKNTVKADSGSSAGQGSNNRPGSERSGKDDGAGGFFDSNSQFGANAVLVEIYGCINIFTPPDKNKLPQADVREVKSEEEPAEPANSGEGTETKEEPQGAKKEK